MFQERDQGRCHRYDLLRAHVHILDLVGVHKGGFTFVTARDQFIFQTAIFGGRGVSLCDHVLAFFNSRQIVHFVGDHTVNDLAVRGLEETVLVGTRVHGQRVDQTDVRTFRSLDRAQTTVVSRVYVSDFKAGTLTSQTARAQRGDTTLVGHFGERVVLVHKLGQLAGTKELFDCGGDRLGVDQILRHQGVQVAQGETLLDRTLDTHQTDAELVLGHFTDRTDTTVTQVVDIVHFVVAVTDVDQALHDFNDVVFGQYASASLVFTTQTAVELHPTYGRQVVTLGGEEQVFEQLFCSFASRRLARTHHAIDLDQRFQTVGAGVDTQGLGHVGTVIQFVGEQNLEVLEAGLGQVGDRFQAQCLVGGHDHLASLRMCVVLGSNFANNILNRYLNLGNGIFFQLTDVTRSHSTTGLNHHGAIGHDVKGRSFTTQTLRHQIHHQLAIFYFKTDGLEEGGQDLFGSEVQGAQNNGCWQFATTVDTDKQVVFRIELEVQPGATVGNNARVIQHLTG